MHTCKKTPKHRQVPCEIKNDVYYLYLTDNYFLAYRGTGDLARAPQLHLVTGPSKQLLSVKLQDLCKKNRLFPIPRSCRLHEIFLALEKKHIHSLISLHGSCFAVISGLESSRSSEGGERNALGYGYIHKKVACNNH